MPNQTVSEVLNVIEPHPSANYDLALVMTET